MMLYKSHLKSCIRNSNLMNGGKILGPINFYILNLLITKGFAREITRNSQIINILNSNISSYFLAKSYYLLGNYSTSISILEKISRSKNKYNEVKYLLAECHAKVGDKKQAWSILKDVLIESSRFKTWLLLANLVDNESEFAELYCLWENAKKESFIPSNHFALNGYIATAALRAKQYDIAVDIWSKLYQKTKENKVTFPNNTKRKLNIDSANETLLSLKNAFDNHKISFFLISGTLLGCIRENRLLSHDKDIDVGIWDDEHVQSALKAIASSGLFEIQSMRSSSCIRVKHVNGVAVDIFIHYREKENYWHSGVKLKWNNSPFKLIERDFLGKKFLIPMNYDLYLTENYGNWRIPKINFDSTFDTPNAEIINLKEIKTHIYKNLCLAIRNENTLEIIELEKRLCHLKNTPYDKALN